MISENCDLPFLSPEPKRVLQMTEASDASSANVQLQTELAYIQLDTEHANRQLNLTKSANREIELANRYAKRQTELAKRQLSMPTSKLSTMTSIHQ